MAGDGKQLELAGIDVLFVGQHVIRHDVDIAGEQVIDAGRGPPIWNLRHAEVALEHQQRPEQISGTTLALVAVIDLAGVGASVIDEFAKIVGWKSPDAPRRSADT